MYLYCKKKKNTLEGINSRISEAEERISELENKMVEITSEEHSKVKRMKRTKDSLRDLWDHIKSTNIRIIGVPGEEEKKSSKSGPRVGALNRRVGALFH